jgi:class 3 adenylate cyclase
MVRGGAITDEAGWVAEVRAPLTINPVYRAQKMVKLQRRPFGEPDNVREVPFGRLETYELGEIRLGRSVLQPGWRWSESIKPIARTELCEDHHIGLTVSGACRVRMREGAELLVEAGQFYEIPPGHDSWVEGDEPWVTVTWQPSTALAQSEGGDFDRVVATLLVTDIVNSTAQALELGDGAWRDLLARHNLVVRNQLDRFRGREVATTGDGFIAVFDGVERAIRAAQAICRAAREIGVDVRTGVHTGEIELEGDNVRGVGVHIAARIAALAGPGEVYASWATRELLAGSAIGFIDRGLHELKGLSEQRRVYEVDSSA